MCSLCVIDKKGLFLLNIYELEALLLSDIKKVEEYYSVSVGKIEDCMKITDPKGYLYKSIKAYSTGDNKALFILLDYDQVVCNCRYFKKFVDDFEKVVQQSAA